MSVSNFEKVSGLRALAKMLEAHPDIGESGPICHNIFVKDKAELKAAAKILEIFEIL